MGRWIERVVLAWLKAVAPADWSDSVLGDLSEDLASQASRRGRRRAIAEMARIAGRFTLDVAATRWHDRTRGGRLMGFGSDVRHAVRSLAASPGFSVAAVLTLALAIGANTAIYSALSALVLNPLPFNDGHRLVFLMRQNPEMRGLLLTPSRPAIEQWRRIPHIFDAVESHASMTVIVSDGGEPEEVNVSLVRPSLFALLGVRPIMGRPFVEADLAAEAAPVALIGHVLWRSRFGGAPDVVGKTLRLGETPYTIVGVMPGGFALPMGSGALWVAARPGASPSTRDTENTIARLAPGVTVEHAQAALDALGPLSAAPDDQGWTGKIMSPADYNGTQIQTALYVLAGAVALLLVIACVNVANLVLSRHNGRKREIAVRHALGASRGRLVRYLLAETSIVAVAGGVAGLVVARAALAAMAVVRPRHLTVLEKIEIDPAVLAFAAAATVLTGLLFGLAPALRASRVDLQDVLKAGGRSMTPSGQRLRRTLTVAQVALALMLLVGASLLLRSYARLTAVDPGFNPAGVLSVGVSLPSSRYPSKDPRRQQFFDQVLATIATLPGVTSAAVGTGVPPSMGINVGRVEIEGRPDASTGHNGLFSGGMVSPAFFSTLGIPVLEGRAFVDTDTAERDRVVVIGASMARRFFPDQSPIGARLRLQTTSPWATVVGVVGDVKAMGMAGDGDYGPQIYQARAQLGPGYGVFVVRSSGDPLTLVPQIKAAIWAQDSQIPVADIATATQLVAGSLSQSRFNMALLVVFALSGVVLAIIGVYGVTALFVGQREREVGIRMALGATRAAVARLVFRQTATVLMSGVALGVFGALWLSRYVETLLFQTAATDPASFVGPGVAVMLSAIVATLIPLRRAIGVEPSIVLRGE